MFKNYLQTGYRNLWKNKVSSLINIIGLGVGMACCILIMLFILDEFSFNKFNKNLKNIYRVDWSFELSGRMNTYSSCPVALAPYIRQDIPQAEYTMRMYQRTGSMENLSAGKIHEKRFQEQNVFFTDNEMFRIFTIETLKGNPEKCLSNANTIVLTDEMAMKYFGTIDVIGKSLFYDNKTMLLITAVVKKMPPNSDMQFDFLINFDTLFAVEAGRSADFLRNQWSYNPAYTFCLLKPGTTQEYFNKALEQVFKKHADQRTLQLAKISSHPFSDVHLYTSDVVGNTITNSSITYVYIFAGIALLILVIASVNFINLSTARASTRSREVGMRKALGADKKQLMIQFLTETFVLTLIAFILALSITHLALPVLNSLTAKTLTWHAWLNMKNMALYILLFFVVGISAGLYPALFITGFRPIEALKGKSGDVNKKNRLRKILLVSQFTISIILIIGASFIYKQLEYLRSKPLGFKKDAILTVPMFGSGATSLSFGVDSTQRSKMKVFAEEIKKNNRVTDVTAASDMPGHGFVQGLVIPEGFSEKDNIFCPWLSVDYNFLDVMKIPLVAGRNFSKSTGTDHLKAMIISEAAVRKFGWKNAEDAIGKTIIRGPAAGGKVTQVIGVIKDFNFNPLDQPLDAIIIDIGVPRLTVFAISIHNDHMNETIEYIKQQWDKIFSDRVFEYSFLENDLNAAYNDKENLCKMIEYFAMIAILLSCLGLFSLSSFLTLQRTKEIGIRKVVGAGVLNVLLLLSKDFITLVLIAFCIATPVAWYCMNKWLQNYAYRIEMSWWIFAGAGLITLLITWITVSTQALKAALASPVKSLRTE